MRVRLEEVDFVHTVLIRSKYVTAPITCLLASDVQPCVMQDVVALIF